MSSAIFFKSHFFLAFVSAGLVAGCASQVVKEDHLKQKTAFALGLEQNDFTVSDRIDDKFQTRYSVKTNDGKRFNCYVEGSFSFGTGNIVSDAICKELTSNNRNTKADETCNKLLKAAGKC